jgi:heterodisulfide reductase subunit A-like polyferredoxin
MGESATIGSVLVVGGGVAGMQAALDLADSGYKVYLAEKESSIGGTMAQLDKTFPSNDCAMCILAPRLVSVGRHLNIEMLPNTQLVGLDGSAGRFDAHLRRRGVFIDPSKCTGCGECASACPVELPNEFNLGFGARKAIARRYPQAVPAAFTISKKERPPCQTACTAGTNVQAYVALTAQGKFAEAIDVVRARMPFASVCGRICLHRCEQECNRGVVDEPVAIMQIKRFLADWDYRHRPELPPPVEKTKAARVAVVGGGPAGLTCAHDLAKQGYPVTLFEASPDLGGMLSQCIPEFRLPRKYIERDLEVLLSPGIDVRTGMRLGTDFTLETLERDGYGAVFLATGAFKPKMLPIPGHDLKGIDFNIEFLRKVRQGEPLGLDGQVLVVGGGNVAIDVARSVRRLGVETVVMACLESRDTMPAHAWEVHDALEEGIEIVNDVTFKRYVGNDGWVGGVEVQKIRSMSFDREGRLALDPIAGSEFVIPADRVIVAIGQSPDLAFVDTKNEISVSRRGLIEVDPETLATARPGVFAGGDVIYEEPRLRVFAGGDVVTGTAFVVDAVAAGHTAAESIERYLDGLPLERTRAKGKPAHLDPEEARRKVRQGEIRKEARAVPERLTPEQAVGTFDEIEHGFDEAAASAEASRCLSCGDCSECLQCLTACQAHAIDHLLPHEEFKTLEVGAVIVATGLETFNPESKPEYGYHRYRDVVTSLEFERILSPTGPFGGKVRRPSDGTAPKKVAFIQCVGSREADSNFCSSVCCMYTAKEAVIAKEHEPGLECTVFYIDIRSGSKGFEQYVDRAKREGVRYVRCRPSAVRESKSDGSLIVEYADESGQHQETFDMVVLATAMRPSEASRQLARSIGIDADEFGFVQSRSFSPAHTSRRGVLVAGPIADPMDIPETVAGASAAAAEAMRLLADSRGTMIRAKEYPPEKDVAAEEPKIGVFVCHCGTNIAGTVDVEQVVQYAKTLPNVAHAERNLYTCSDDTQKRIREKIDELGLNRVVVASCTPRTHEALFQETIREAGLNPYYFELANIRDQCSWVHMHQKEAATGKAKDLVRMALAKARLDSPLYKRPLTVSQAALVIGGGAAGMTAALELADQGFQVHLVEREAELGGHARSQRRLLSGEDPRQGLWELMARVRMHPKIDLRTAAKVIEVSGSLGNFRSTIEQGETRVEIDHGVVIVATGAERYVPTELLYGKDPRVIRQFELEELIADQKLKADSVVFVQCVGSRNEERAWCSRTCCLETVKNALRIKEQSPATDVHVLYRDIRTYGAREKYYREAREKGVRFIRYADGTLPAVAPHNGRLSVSVEDQMSKRTVELEADTLVLAAATIPNPGNKELAQLLKVPLSEEGFFLEAHRKLRPVDFATEGVFLCGAAHSPLGLRETATQAAAVAARAATILARGVIDLEPTISHVVEQNCDGCAYCVDPCPYHAIAVVEYSDEAGTTKKRVKVDEALCKGCGTCEATCPKNGIFVWHFRPEQLTAQIHAALNLEG